MLTKNKQASQPQQQQSSFFYSFLFLSLSLVLLLQVLNYFLPLFLFVYTQWSWNWPIALEVIFPHTILLILYLIVYLLQLLLLLFIPCFWVLAIALLFEGVQTIAPEENCPPDSVRVWVRIRVGFGGNFPWEQLSQTLFEYDRTLFLGWQMANSTGALGEILQNSPEPI